MSNQYDRKLAHKYFYAAPNESGNYKNSNTWFSNRTFYSYSAPIAVLRESKLIKEPDYDTGKDSKVPAKVMFLTEQNYSQTTSTHKQELQNACPRNVEILTIPFGDWKHSDYRSQSVTVEEIGKDIYNAIYRLLKYPVTNRDQRQYFYHLLNVVERFQAHFGKRGIPTGFTVKVRNMKELIEDEERYAVYCRVNRAKLAKKTRRENARRRKVIKTYSLSRPFEGRINRLVCEREDKCRGIRSAFEDKWRAIAMERFQSGWFNSTAEDTVAEPAEHDLISTAYANSLSLASAIRTDVYKSYSAKNELAESVIKNLGRYIYSPHRRTSDYVMPKFRVSPASETGGKPTVFVHPTLMVTSMGLTVSREEVIKMLRIRRAQQKLVGRQFEAGWRILSNDESGVVVGCHRFYKEVVDALQDLLLNHTQSQIEDLYQASFDREVKSIEKDILLLSQIDEDAKGPQKEIDDIAAEYAPQIKQIHEEAAKALRKEGCKWEYTTY